MKSRILTTIGLVASLISASASAQERSYLCKFTFGPRAGQVQDYTGHPSGPLPVGSSCQDGMGSGGVIISGGGGGGDPSDSGGSCMRPSSEEDCDACRTDRSFERCLEKLEE